MKIKNIFRVCTGSRIIAEDVYKHQGAFPCVTSQTKDDGIAWRADEKWLINNYGSKIIRANECLTWTKDGVGAGTMFYRDYSFYPNDHCGVLILKDEYKDELDLKWFLFTHAAYIRSFATADSAKPMLYNGTVKEIDINYPFPDIVEQKRIVEQLERKKEIEEKIKNIELMCEELKKIGVDNSYSEYQAKDVEVASVFECISGNSGLTEEFIYNHQNDDGEKCKVLSSSTDESTAMGNVSENTFLNGKKIKSFRGCGILVSRNGDAGAMKYLQNGLYTMNDHAYIIHAKDKLPYKIDLQWFAETQGSLVKSYSSGKGNSTWNKKLFFQQAHFDIPSFKEQRAIARQYQKVDQMLNDIEELKRSFI